MTRLSLILNVLVKATLVALLAHSLFAPDLPQFQDKAMLVRQVAFPLALFVVPGWWLWRGRPQPYPHLIDALVVFPFVFDLFGNATDLYNSVEHWDDVTHALNPLVFVVMASLVLRAAGMPRWVAFLVATGLASTVHIVFELIEFRLFQGGNPRLAISLADTLSDLGWGLIGSLLGGLIGATIPAPQERRRSTRRDDSAIDRSNNPLTTLVVNIPKQLPKAAECSSPLLESLRRSSYALGPCSPSLGSPQPTRSASTLPVAAARRPSNWRWLPR